MKMKHVKTQVEISRKALDTVLDSPVFLKKKCIILVDERIKKIYGHLFLGIKFPIIPIKSREAKSLKNLEGVTKKLIRMNVTRDTVLVSIGGGQVSDFTGFLASIYKRGVDHVIVPTTLLAMVDASIGGKTAIDIKNTKNALGTFHPPLHVIIHEAFLESLPEKEYKNGLVEIVKIAAISDKKLFKFIEQNCEAILARDPQILNKLIIQSVKSKQRIVNKDQYDEGERVLLNYGHTIGHALEKNNLLSHGQAVAAGIRLENNYAQRKGYVSTIDAMRIEKLLGFFGLKLNIQYERKKTLQGIKKDKKNISDSLRLPVVSEIGKGKIALIASNEIEDLLP
jgi:3-dehydroquinate synthase